MGVLKPEHCIGSDDLFDDWYVCPNCDCNNVARGFRFCPDCGDKNDWTLIEAKEQRIQQEKQLEKEKARAKERIEDERIRRRNNKIMKGENNGN